MKGIVANLNKNFENRIRLGIMSILVVNDWIDFNTMKEMLGLTDGNLATHTNALEKEKYIETQKVFVGKKTKTSYKATLLGIEAFKAHLNALEAILRSHS